MTKLTGASRPDQTHHAIQHRGPNIDYPTDRQLRRPKSAWVAQEPLANSHTAQRTKQQCGHAYPSTCLPKRSLGGDPDITHQARNCAASQRDARHIRELGEGTEKGRKGKPRHRCNIGPAASGHQFQRHIFAELLPYDRSTGDSAADGQQGS